MLLSQRIVRGTLALQLTESWSSYFFDHSVRVLKGDLIHVHKVCLQGGKDGFVVANVSNAERVLRPRYRGHLPGAYAPLPFRPFTRDETERLFQGVDSTPRKVELNKNK